MTTVVPKVLKSDAVPFKASQSARAAENNSSSFARALRDADVAKTAVRRASEAADNSVRSRTQTSESGGLADSGDDSILNGTRSPQSGDPETVAKNFGDAGEALAVDSANVAGLAAPLVKPAGTSTAFDANNPINGAPTTEVAGVAASAAVAKAVGLAQTAAIWANGGQKDATVDDIANLQLGSSSMGVAGEVVDTTAANVLSMSLGSTIPGVIDPEAFAAPLVGSGSVFPDSSAAGAEGASGFVPSGFAGGANALGGVSTSLQGAGQGSAVNRLLNSGRPEASERGVGTIGWLSASHTNSSGAASVASALAAASTVRSAHSSALSDSVGLSTTAGSITGTLSVSLMSGSAGADLGGSALGSQTGGAGNESGASSGGPRSGNSNAFTVQTANPADPNGMTAISGGAAAATSAARTVGLGNYANVTAADAEAAISPVTTNAISEVDVDVAVNRQPALDANTAEIQASVAADPRSAWRDLRSKWDQPIRANAPKG